MMISLNWTISNLSLESLYRTDVLESSKATFHMFYMFYTLYTFGNRDLNVNSKSCYLHLAPILLIKGTEIPIRSAHVYWPFKIDESTLGLSAKKGRRSSFQPGKHLLLDRSPTDEREPDHAAPFAWNG